jgi:hypothetical protein
MTQILVGPPLAVPLERRDSLFAELGEAPLPEQEYLRFAPFRVVAHATVNPLARR